MRKKDKLIVIVPDGIKKDELNVLKTFFEKYFRVNVFSDRWVKHYIDSS